MISAAREIVAFDAGGQRYGISAENVLELVRSVFVTPLPQAPEAVAGVIDYHGQIVPVYSLRRRFRLPNPEVRASDHFIMVRLGDRVVALCVDGAVDLTRVDQADAQEAESVASGIEYVAWIARQPHDLVLIHDLRTFLSRSEADRLAGALAALAGAEQPTLAEASS